MFAYTLLLACLPVLEMNDNTWPQWRGPNRNGFVAENSPTWPSKLQGDALVKKWNIPLGPSYSGAIVTSDKVFVTETVDKKYEVVKALDRQTGKELWKQQWEGAMSVPFFAKANGDWIRSTPSFDGERLYVGGIRDVLVCLDAATGKEVWKLDFPKEFNAKLPDFGFVCSPLLVGDHVYVQAGGTFCKLEKVTGKVVWKTLADGGGMFGSAFSSPVYSKIAGVEQLVVQTRTKLAGVNAADGAVLWSIEVPAERGMNILTPTVVDDTVFTASYGGGMFLYGVTKENDKFSVKQVWKNKTEGYMTSPILIDGHVYFQLKNQCATCVEVKTGQAKWTTSKRFGKYWSMVAQRDRILALDEKGDLILFRATPEKYEPLDTRKVSDNAWAHLAVSGDEVYVRELNGLTVYTWK